MALVSNHMRRSHSSCWLPSHLSQHRCAAMNGNKPLNMDFHPFCKKNFCNICHAHAQYLILEQNSGPGYKKPTSLSRSRLIQTAMERPRKRSMSIPIRRTGPGMMSLAVEVRLQIYRDCIRDDENGEVKIHGWYKGGGLHADHRNTVKRKLNGLFIYASHRFTAGILCLNKTIYAEARDEIFRNIRFRIEAKVPTIDVPQLKYWLTENPMRFTKHISVTVDFAVNPSREFCGRNMYCSSRQSMASHYNTLLCDADMRNLAKMLGTLPNLETVHIILGLDCCGGSESTRLLLKGLCQDDENYVQSLRVFQAALRKGLKLRLLVSFSDWYHKKLKVLRVESERVVTRLIEEGFDAEMAERKKCSVARFSWGI